MGAKYLIDADYFSIMKLLLQENQLGNLKNSPHLPTEPKIITRFVNRRMPCSLFLHLFISDLEQRRSRAPLHSDNSAFFIIILWIFFAIPIEQRRLIIF